MAYYNSNTSSAPANSSLGMNGEKPDEQASGAAAPVALSTASANGANAGAGTQSGPTAAPLSGNPVGQNTTTPKAASSGMSGGFQSYQKANQGAAQNKLAQAAQNNVSAQGQAATTGIAQAQDQFGKKVDAGSLTNRYQALQDVSNTLNSARTLNAAARPAAPAPVTTAPAAAGASPIVQPPTQQDYIPQVAGADRFSDVINAKYNGPESLRQSGLYNDAAKKASTAQTTLNQTKTANGREQMLADMYAKRGNYTQGLNKLDSAVLNSSQVGVQGLQDTAKAQGDIQGSLDKAQLGSTAMAQNRGQEIQGIRNQARDKFSVEKAAEVKATDDRLANQVENWDKLPEYFRNVLRDQANGGVGLNSAEAATLGIQNGEGLYNAGADVIKSGVADKQKLVTRDEQARQAALSQLAGLDKSNVLDTNLKYNNAEKAGTQTSLDALDLEGTRAGLNQAEQGFQDYAKGANLTGYGVKKNKSSGKKYYSESTANIGDVLKNAGYNFDNVEAKNSVGNQDVLKNLAGVTKRSMDQDVDGMPSKFGLNSLEDIGNSGQSAAGAAIDSNPVAGGINMGLNLVGGKSIGQTVSNIFGSAPNSAQSKQVAKSQAQQDLENKMTSAVDQAGFNNRFKVEDNEKNSSRLAALQQLISNMDKSNQG